MTRCWGGAAAMLLLTIGTAIAAPSDFRFEPVTTDLRPGRAEVVVRLLTAGTGKAVADAIIIKNKVEMVMAGMAPMAAKTTPAQSDGNGQYRFTAELSMPGEWQVSLAAKVQGEIVTVRGTVTIAARA
jgi:YtkA-like